MLGEMLNHAANSGDEYVLLKLVVVKAFDKMEWPFLLEELDKAGFSGTLTVFLDQGQFRLCIPKNPPEWHSNI